MLPLKDAIHDKHKQAEKMPFNARMFKGLLTPNEYLLYLEQQLQIFRVIEKKGIPYPGLARTMNISADIAEIKAESAITVPVLKSTKKYFDYLQTLSYEQLLPHIYLNYMAILFGGQMMKKAVPSAGKMYDFDNMKEAVQSIRDVQKDEWAPEVNRGFDFIIPIFEELEAASLNF